MVRARATEHADANVSQVLRLSPRGDANVGIIERSALARGAAVARERDAEEKQASRERSARRASLSSTASLTPRASQLDWTVETGMVVTDDEDAGAAILTDVEEEYEEEPRSPESAPTQSDRDFVVPDSGIDARDDESYVYGEDESGYIDTDEECDELMTEEEGLTMLLKSGELTPQQYGLVVARLSSIRAPRTRRTLWSDEGRDAKVEGPGESKRQEPEEPEERRDGGEHLRAGNPYHV